MLESIRVKSFRRYADATFRLKPGVNFIEGENSAGKTTLLYAIEYALFGRVDGFKTVSALVSPKARGVGVELVFRGKDGLRYRLQRAHATPKGKRTMLPGFTLKVAEAPVEGAEGEPNERYLLSSDFADTEDTLQLKIQELTGITRRLFLLAVHMRQGDIARILEGEPKLDIVLGVTAAVIAEEELRGMALDAEKQAAELPALEPALERVLLERQGVDASIAAAEAEESGIAARAAGLEERRGGLREREAAIAPARAASAALWKAVSALSDATRRASEAGERRDAAIAKGGPREAAAEVARAADARVAEITTARASLAEAVAQAEAERRTLDTTRGDLGGRVARREAMLKKADAEAPICETCGSPIDTAHALAEIREWREEIATIDVRITAAAALLGGLREQRGELDAEERRLVVASSEARRHVASLDELGGAVTTEGARKDAASTAANTAKDHARTLEDVPDGEPAAVYTAIEAALADRVADLRAQAVRVDAEADALREMRARVQAATGQLRERRRQIERDATALDARIGELRAVAARARRIRTMSAAFKVLQGRLRSDAAAGLAVDMLAIHQGLSNRRDEFAALSIDPSRYAVEVTPAHLGESVAASVYEGGGHKLLLGLAFRLAIVRRLGQVPFVLMDEPTYGLDAAHREALLARLGGLGLIGQVLLITHEAMGAADGHRVRVGRKGDTSEILEAM